MSLGPTLLAMGAVGAAFGLLLGTVRWLATRRPLHPELRRKAVHIGMGLFVLPLPWVFDSAWPVMVLAALSVAALLALRWHPRLRAGMGSVLGGVERISLGEVYFPIAVGVLFAVSHERWLFYVIPIVILALADAVAALIGVRYGTLPYLTAEGTKSIEGSVAFFFVAFMAVLVPLLLWTEVDRVETLLLSLTIAFLVMMLESVAWRGLDNLFVPFGAYAFLQLYVPLDAGRLAARLLVGVVLLVFVFFWRKRSELDDSALVAAALVGYGTFMIGGWIWILPPLSFFLAQHLLWPRPGRPRILTTQGVVSVSTAGLTWLFAFAATGADWTLVPFAASFGTALSLYGISRLARLPEAEERGRRMLFSTLASWAVACLPAITIAYGVLRGFSAWTLADLSVDLAFTLLTVFALSVGFFRLVPRIYGREAPEHAPDLAFSLFGVAASLAPCLRWLLSG